MELTTFRLRAGIDVADFVAADALAQAFAHLQPGLLRRTTARDLASDEWLVAILWSSWEHADAATAAARDDAGMQAYEALIDPASVQVRRFESLDR